MEVPGELTGGKVYHAAPLRSLRYKPTPVQVAVRKAQDLKTRKNNALVTLVRVEYNGAVLGVSSETDVLPDGTADYEFTTSFECSPEGPNSLDVLVQKPLLFTVLQVGPKEKKKQEKIMPLGQAVVDLLPLLKGVHSVRVFAPLYAVSASSPESFHPKAMGSLEVVVSTKELLLSATQFSSGNLLSITLEAAYSVPDTFTTEAQQNYMACLQMPGAGEKELLLLFKNGILKADGEKEPFPRPKIWPLGTILAPAALIIPNSSIVGGLYEDEDGELTRTEDMEFRIQAESSRRIVWDMENRCYLDAAAEAVLRQRIAKCHYWPVELCRMSLALAGKGKGSKSDKGDEDKQISFHGVAYVNMLPLLCPGVKRIRGAFRVLSYEDSEVLKKTKIQHSIFRDLRSQLSLAKEGLGASPASRAVPAKAQKEEKDSNRTLLNPSKIQLSDGTGGSENVTNLSLEGQQYSEAGTFLVMEIKLNKPLVPKRLPEDLAQRCIPVRCLGDMTTLHTACAHDKPTFLAVDLADLFCAVIDRVKELIPSRPELPQRFEGARKAVEDYHKHITSIAVAILSEYHDRFGDQLPDEGGIDPETLEEQKRQLNYELSTSGKYFAFKEQLKYSVVRIVREKYMKTTAFETQEELQTFLSDLYVYLVDHMHIALNKLLSDEDICSVPPSYMTRKQLWLFAREAEANKDFQLASRYYEQRIAKDERHIQSWLDYGAFCLLHEDVTKARECFLQALSLDRQHTQSLLLCGIVAVMLQRYEDAEVFFEDACSEEPSSIIAWTLSGLFYEMQGNVVQAERNFREAKKLLRAQLEEERRILEAAGGGEGKKSSSPSTDTEECLPEKIPDGSADKQPEVVEHVTPKEEAAAPQEAPEEPCHAPRPQPPPCTIFTKTVEFLMKVNAVQFVHRALAHELLNLQGGPTCAYYLARAWTYLQQEDFPRCAECLREAIRIDPMNPNVWAQKGHLCYLRRDFDTAKDCYERVISFLEDAVDVHFVYLRLGSIYLEEKEYGRAKQIYLLASDNSATCLTWLGVGIACYRLGEMSEAEDALSEANALDNTNAEVWAYLTLICLQGERKVEAEQCFKYATKLLLRNDALLREIRAAQHRLGFGDPSL